jgi:hypothetical protein
MFAILHALGMFLADMFKSRGTGIHKRGSHQACSCAALEQRCDD